MKTLKIENSQMFEYVQNSRERGTMMPPDDYYIKYMEIGKPSMSLIPICKIGIFYRNLALE